MLANAAVERLLGWRPDELVGRDVTMLWPDRLHRRYRELLAGISHERPASGPALEGEYLLCHRDGHELLAHVASRWIDTEQGPVSVSSLTDLAERGRVERVLRSLAERDPLTGLLNRRRFEEELGTAVARAVRYGEAAALLALDLDQFKEVNDTFGHQAGDELLRAVAERLRGRLRESDMLARLGGDEFAVLLPQAELEQGDRVATDLLETLRAEPFTLSGQARRVTASAGVTTIGGRDPSADALLMEADSAMYDAKQGGRDRVARFSEACRERMAARRTWADRIRGALAHDGFELHGQPIVDLATGEPARIELLLRLPDPEGGLALPALFLPIAERFDLMRTRSSRTCARSRRGRPPPRAPAARRRTRARPRGRRWPRSQRSRRPAARGRRRARAPPPPRAAAARGRLPSRPRG